MDDFLEGTIFGSGSAQVKPMIQTRVANGWDIYFDDICKAIAKKSKDPNTKLGCVIASTNNAILTTGFNGFCRGVDEKNPVRWADRNTKYFYVEHAERNAIYNAARNGSTSLCGSVAYIPVWPCNECAKALIQSGIYEVRLNTQRINERTSQLQYRLPDHEFQKAMEELEMVKDHLQEAGVHIVLYNRVDGE